MPRGPALTLEQWVDRLLLPNADIVRRALKKLPSYVRLDALSLELSRRGYMLAHSATHFLVIRGSYLVINQQGCSPRA